MASVFLCQAWETLLALGAITKQARQASEMSRTTLKQQTRAKMEAKSEIKEGNFVPEQDKEFLFLWASSTGFQHCPMGEIDSWKARFENLINEIEIFGLA